MTFGVSAENDRLIAEDDAVGAGDNGGVLLQTGVRYADQRRRRVGNPRERESQSSLTRRGMPPAGFPALKGRATVIPPLRGDRRRTAGELIGLARGR